MKYHSLCLVALLLSLLGNVNGQSSPKGGLFYRVETLSDVTIQKEDTGINNITLALLIEFWNDRNENVTLASPCSIYISLPSVLRNVLCGLTSPLFLPPGKWNVSVIVYFETDWQRNFLRDVRVSIDIPTSSKGTIIGGTFQNLSFPWLPNTPKTFTMTPNPLPDGWGLLSNTLQVHARIVQGSLNWVLTPYESTSVSFDAVVNIISLTQKPTSITKGHGFGKLVLFPDNPAIVVDNHSPSLPAFRSYCIKYGTTAIIRPFYALLKYIDLTTASELSFQLYFSETSETSIETVSERSFPLNLTISKGNVAYVSSPLPENMQDLPYYPSEEFFDGTCSSRPPHQNQLPTDLLLLAAFSPFPIILVYYLWNSWKKKKLSQNTLVSLYPDE